MAESLEQPAQAAKDERAPLEELMLAMDVVDTLRHRQGVVERELNAEDRRARLIEQLREIYSAQGIDVTDAVLAEGVRALEEDRFKYTPYTESLQTRMANWYVNRSRWGKPLLILLGALGISLAGYLFLVKLPEMRERAALPNALDSTFGQIVQVAQDPVATDRAQILLRDARAAFEADDYAEANGHRLELESLLTQLQQAYELRIVSRPNELSGVWRVPAINPNARNYYIIVEALDNDGKRLRLPIANEEDGKRRLVNTWGVRVDQSTFDAVAADKRDDGIIQGNVIGRKTRGELAPEYLVPTTGDTITDW